MDKFSSTFIWTQFSDSSLCDKQETDINQTGLYCCCILIEKKRGEILNGNKERESTKEKSSQCMLKYMTCKRDRMKKIVIKWKIQQEY